MRYFYRDPLAAAWMAKHFGMQFAVNPQVVQQDFDLIDVDAMEEDFEAESTNGDHWLFFVHPESLHLLEPRVGDMVTHFGLRAWRIDSMDAYAYYHPNMPNESIGRYTLKTDKPAIIQRNGIPFHWPESE